MSYRRRLSLLMGLGLSMLLVIIAMPAMPVRAVDPVFVTTITVNTVADLDFNMSTTCSNPANPCTLRRAIVQARGLSSGQRPVRIAFNLPAGEANLDAAAGTWTIVIGEGASADLRDLAGGQVTIDGSTQPGGRASGPKVFIRGSTQADRLVINGDNNRLVNLGFQYLNVIFNVSNNLVENVWSGLQESGQAIYFLRDNPEVDSRASFEDNSASSGNVYRNVVISGSRTMAITMRGDNGTIENSFFGTRGDGTVPAVAADRKCWPNARYNNWFGGQGVTLFGTGTTVRNNRFVGLLNASRDPLNTPPTAIDINTADNLVENNIIGVDSAGQHVGTCGDAIRMTSRDNILRNNTIYGAGVRNGDENKSTEGEQPQTGAIGISGNNAELDANLIRSNVISDSIAPVFFFPSVNVRYSYFNPAKVTAINATAVTGTSGDPGQPPPPNPPVDSTCPNCVIELFLDNRDGNIETLQSLGTTTANAQGNWTFTLPRALTANEGLRTQSTTAANGTITDFDAGTSTRVSRNLYGPNGVITTPLPPTRPGASAPTNYTPLQPRAVPAIPSYSFVTTITVNSSSDPDTSQSTTCTSSPCTLRRAIVQARALPAGQRPVRIAFNLPTSDPGYNGTLQVWRIDLNSASNNYFRSVDGGQIVIDGTTQPGGRASGPKIFVRGSNSQHILVLNGRGNLVRGLGLQGFGMQINAGGNFIEQNWLGLSEDGQSIYYINGDNTRDNKATLQDAETPPADTGGNVFRNNVVTGSRGSAMTIRSDDSWVVGNYIGTRPDGTIPTSGAAVCTDPSWISGEGIELMGGIGTQVGGPTEAERNYLVGLSVRSADPNVTQPIGVQIGEVGDYLVQNNYIGRDTAGNNVGVCGEGVRINGDFSLVRDNYIVTTQNAVVNHLPNVVGGNANTYRSNLFVGNQQPIIFGPIVPDELAYFNPAKITRINGTAVTGTSGDPGQPPGGRPPIDSSCPFCTVEIFLDDRDSQVETLQSFGTTVANAQGNWSFTLPRALTSSEGLRTQSTAGTFGVIKRYEAGTTTKISTLYIYTPGPTLSSTNGTNGGAGSAFGFTAAGFAAQASVTISVTPPATTGLDSATLAAPYVAGTVNADASGSVSFAVLLGSGAPAGTYTVTASSGSSQVSSQITVSPSASVLSPPANVPIVRGLPTTYLPLVRR